MPAGKGIQQRQVQHLAVLPERNILARAIHNLLDAQIAVQFKSKRGDIRAGDYVHTRLGAQKVLGGEELGIDDVVFDLEAWTGALRPGPMPGPLPGPNPTAPRGRSTGEPAEARENADRFTVPDRIILGSPCEIVPVCAPRWRRRPASEPLGIRGFPQTSRFARQSSCFRRARGGFTATLIAGQAARGELSVPVGQGYVTLGLDYRVDFRVACRQDQFL